MSEDFVFEMWIWKRMEKISWTDHDTNKKVLAGIVEERTMIYTTKKRQRKCIGHRGDSLPRIVIEGKME